MRSRIPSRSAALLIPLALLLAGCAAPGSDAVTTTAEPVTIDNCGFDVTIDPLAPPQRIVTIKSTSTELLIALGLGERIVGQAFPDDPLPDDLAAELGDVEIPTISDFAPSEEAVLDLDPDAVFGGWESNFAADTAGERDELASLGVLSYVSPAACRTEGYQPDPLTADLLFSYFAEAGAVFGADDAAAALIETQRAELAEVAPDTRGLTALWWSSGDDVPYVGAGIGAPQLMLDAVGLTNIAADVHDGWTSLGWEAIAAADPDVIVFVDASWNTAESKIATLEADPVLSKLSAVEAGRYLILPFPAAEAGVRTVPGIVDLAAQLAAIEVE